MRLRYSCSTAGLLLLCAAASHADSAACRSELIDAYKKSFEAPRHTYTSEIESGAQGLVSRSEMIDIGNKSYVKLNGVHVGNVQLADNGWAMSRRSPQETAKKTLEMMRDAVKDTKNYRCTRVRDEMIDGVDAAVYSEHVETDVGKSDARTWISKTQGWLIKYEAKMDNLTSTTRYEYTDVQPPSDASAKN